VAVEGVADLLALEAGLQERDSVLPLCSSELAVTVLSTLRPHSPLKIECR
jgi:hypothetical protein